MREGNKDTVDLLVFVVLCPDCDKIHLILELDGEQIFSQGLPDELWNAMFSRHAQLVRKRKERAGESLNAN